MHYHIYVGSNIESKPKDTFSFTSSQSAIDKVMELIESYGTTSDVVEVTHHENKLGRFSTIIVPTIDYKIILHECAEKHNSSIPVLDISKLN